MMLTIHVRDNPLSATVEEYPGLYVMADTNADLIRDLVAAVRELRAAVRPRQALREGVG